MNTYPSVDISKKNYPLQSILFGHRIQASQTKFEYLIEFLQVVLAEKRGGDKVLDAPTFVSNDMFPIDVAANADFKYLPHLGIFLKRFVFFSKSKIDGKAKVDEDAYRQLLKELEAHMAGAGTIKKKNSITIIQNLLNGFSAVNQSRSWFDQNVLPVCPEVVLPEGMGIKNWRQGLSFSQDDPDVDSKFDYHKYTYMCRGGEVYYLHILSAISEHPEYKEAIETRLYKMISSFPQFSYLCNFVKRTWEDYYTANTEIDPVIKELGVIPMSFSQRNLYTLKELTNLLSSKAHPFEKMEILANGLILQLLRMMYLAASTPTESNCWIIDVNCSGFDNAEAKKNATIAFRHNEEVISTYLYKGLEQYRSVLSEKKDDQKIIKEAADDSYRLFRKLGKMIGVIIPVKGKNMRFTLSEEILKFLVLAIVPPKQMITLDVFVSSLYNHFGIVIGPEQYKMEMGKGSVAPVGDFSFLESNLKAFAQKLKDCGFLRDLSDATSIVENPYELEEIDQ